MSTAIPYLLDLPRELYAGVYFTLKGVDFVSVIEEDWDNLIILDGCRYDIFENEYTGVGKLEQRYSLGANTPQFLRRNFAGTTCFDTVYVTANPQHKQVLDDRHFHTVYDVWDTDWEGKSVPPEAVSDRALEAYDAHPHKKLIVHYIQPHAPFIGDWAKEHIKTGSNTNAYKQAKAGEITDAELERGYRENLRLVLRELHSLVSDLNGKTVVTSDHGNLLGERAYPYLARRYQHPSIMAKKLLQVPWLAIEGGERRPVKAEKQTSESTSSQDDIERRLRDLGYS